MGILPYLLGTLLDLLGTLLDQLGTLLDPTKGAGVNKKCPKNSIVGQKHHLGGSFQWNLSDPRGNTLTGSLIIMEETFLVDIGVERQGMLYFSSAPKVSPPPPPPIALPSLGVKPYCEAATEPPLLLFKSGDTSLKSGDTFHE